MYLMGFSVNHPHAAGYRTGNGTGGRRRNRGDEIFLKKLERDAPIREAAVAAVKIFFADLPSF